MSTTHAIVKIEVREDDLDSEAYRAEVTCSCGSRMGVFWAGNPAEVLVHVQTYFDQVHLDKTCEAESIPALLGNLHTIVIKYCGLPSGHDGAHYDFAQRRRWRDEARRFVRRGPDEPDPAGPHQIVEQRAKAPFVNPRGERTAVVSVRCACGFRGDYIRHGTDDEIRRGAQESFYALHVWKQTYLRGSNHMVLTRWGQAS